MNIIIRKLRVIKDIVSHKDSTCTADVVRFGRGADQEVHLPNSRVALEHATLSKTPSNQYEINCVSTTTFIHGGQPLTSKIIVDEDEIEIGSFKIKFLSSNETDWILELSEQYSDQTEGLKNSLKNRSFPNAEELLPKRRLLALTLAAVFALIGFIVPFIDMNKNIFSTKTTILSKQQLMPGVLSIHHSEFSKDCTNCHAENKNVSLTNSCQTCHEGNLQHASSTIMQVDNYECSTCHWEHHKTKLGKISRSDEQFCADCHEEVAKGSTLLAVNAFSTHPQFRVPLQLNNDGSVKKAVRIDEYLQNTELSLLKFPHKSHLVGKVYNIKQGSEETLNCSSCHISDSAGNMQKISFEDHCSGCHIPTLTENNKKLELPHGNLNDLVSVVENFYKNFEPNQEKVASKKILRRPGSKKKLDSRTLHQKKTLWSEERSQSKIKEIVFYTGCNTCHKLETDLSDKKFPWRIASIDQVNWYDKAIFNHTAHEDQKCNNCHMGITSSTSSKDILLPTVDNCQSCHLGGSSSPLKVASTCVTCHAFHKNPVTEIKQVKKGRGKSNEKRVGSIY